MSCLRTAALKTDMPDEEWKGDSNTETMACIRDASSQCCHCSGQQRVCASGYKRHAHCTQTEVYWITAFCFRFNKHVYILVGLVGSKSMHFVASITSTEKNLHFICNEDATLKNIRTFVQYVELVIIPYSKQCCLHDYGRFPPLPPMNSYLNVMPCIWRTLYLWVQGVLTTRVEQRHWFRQRESLQKGPAAVEHTIYRAGIHFFLWNAWKRVPSFTFSVHWTLFCLL